MLQGMRTLVCVVLLMAVVVWAGPVVAAEQCADDEGWISLFNGEDLSGWQNARKPDAENKWLVEDGLLTNKDHANNIGTIGNYKNFCLKLEYKIVAKGNSGVYLRGRVEVQILDSHGKEKLVHGDDGGIYGQYAPAVNASNPAGEWNTLWACYKGDTLIVKLNGKIVQDSVTIAKRTGGALPGGVNEAGPIMLQGDHGKIWFRNMMIRPCETCPVGKAGKCPFRKDSGK